MLSRYCCLLAVILLTQPLYAQELHSNPGAAMEADVQVLDRWSRIAASATAGSSGRNFLDPPNMVEEGEWGPFFTSLTEPYEDEFSFSVTNSGENRPRPGWTDANYGAGVLGEWSASASARAFQRSVLNFDSENGNLTSVDAAGLVFGEAAHEGAAAHGSGGGFSVFRLDFEITGRDHDFVLEGVASWDAGNHPSRVRFRTGSGHVSPETFLDIPGHEDGDEFSVSGTLVPGRYTLEAHAQGGFLAWDGNSGEAEFAFDLRLVLTPAPDQALTPPALVSPADDSSGVPLNPVLAWRSVPFADTYRLQVSEAEDFSGFFFDLPGLSATSQQVAGLHEGVTYFWRVNSRNSEGTSDWSQVRHFTTIQENLLRWVGPDVNNPSGAFGVDAHWLSVADSTVQRFPEGDDTALYSVFDLGPTSYSVSFDGDRSHRRARVDDRVTFDLNGATYHLDGPRDVAPVSLAVGVSSGRHASLAVAKGVLRTAADVEVQATAGAGAGLTIANEARLVADPAGEGAIRVGTHGGFQSAVLTVEPLGEIRASSLAAGASGQVDVQANDLVVGGPAYVPAAAPGLFLSDGLTASGGARLRSLHAAIDHPLGLAPPVVVSGEETEWFIHGELGEPLQFEGVLDIPYEAQFGHLLVGIDGYGAMVVEDGAVVHADLGIVGLKPGSQGVALVRNVGADEPSRLILPFGLVVGQGGAGTLHITNGSLVETWAGDWRHIGREHGSQGTVSISGPGSVLHVHSHGPADDPADDPPFEPVEVGAAGQGAINITGGGLLEAETGIALGVSGHGALSVTNGRVNTAGIALGVETGAFGEAQLMGPETVVESVATIVGMAGRGRMIIGSGARFSGALMQIRAEDGTEHEGPAMMKAEAVEEVLLPLAYVRLEGEGTRLEITDRLEVGLGGRGKLELKPGTVASVEVLLVQGTVELEDAEMEAFLAVIAPGGRIIGTGTFTVTGEDFINSGLVSVGNSPGTLTIDGNYEQGGGGTLRIEVAGPDEGDYNVLHVTGDASIAGTVELVFVDGYAPREGDAFAFLKTEGHFSSDDLELNLMNLMPGFEYEAGFLNGAFSLTALNDGEYFGRPQPAQPIAGATHVPPDPVLSWQPVEGALQYHVQMALDESFSDMVFEAADLAEPEVEAGTLAFNTVYLWRVRAMGDGVESAWSEVRAFRTTLSPPLPAAPGDGADGVSVRPTLSWQAVEGARNYDVHVAEDEAFESVVATHRIRYLEVELDSLEFTTHYYWRVRARDADGAGMWSDVSTFTTGTGVSTEDYAAQQPTAFALHPNYPNPFNPSTRITYDLPEPAHVVIRVFDALGREVAVLVDRQQAPGRYEVTFDSGVLPSGLYLYRMEAGEFRQVRRMVVVR